MLNKEEYLERQSRLYDSFVGDSASMDKSSAAKAPPGDYYRVIDFSKEKTERGWQISMYRLALNAVPVWFDLLKWIMILAVLKLMAAKGGSHLLAVVYTLSYFWVGYYFLAFFDRIWFKGLPFIGSERRQFLLSVILSVLLTLGGYWCVSYLVEIVATMSK